MRQPAAGDTAGTRRWADAPTSPAKNPGLPVALLRFQLAQSQPGIRARRGASCLRRPGTAHRYRSSQPRRLETSKRTNFGSCDRNARSIPGHLHAANDPATGKTCGLARNKFMHTQGVSTATLHTSWILVGLEGRSGTAENPCQMRGIQLSKSRLCWRQCRPVGNCTKRIGVSLCYLGPESVTPSVRFPA